MLTTHGFPKSGTHALVKACQLLGVPCEVHHLTYAQGLPEGTTKDIFIVRDPRNVVVSWLRMHGQPVTPGTFLAAFRKFHTDSLVNEMAAYEPWIVQSYHVARYEALIANRSEMIDIADYLDVPYIEGAWEQLPGMTRTWNAEPSDYRSVWSPDVEAAWKAEGGRTLVEDWGYEWNS